MNVYFDENAPLIVKSGLNFMNLLLLQYPIATILSNMDLINIILICGHSLDLNSAFVLVNNNYN